MDGDSILQFPLPKAAVETVEIPCSRKISRSFCMAQVEVSI